MIRNKDTLYCNICNGVVILPSPAFMPCNQIFVSKHIDCIEHLENLNNISYIASDGCSSVVENWQAGISK